jgi:LysM repeat protein
MNNSNPLIPQGSNLEQKIKGRSRVKLAVFIVLAVHVLFLGPLLMQGCKREQTPAPAAETNNLPPVESLTNELPQLTNGATQPPVTINPPITGIAAPPAAAATEYTVIKGDSFYSLGRKFGVSIKAIADANPGVDSTKLKIGQKLMIPPPAAAAIPASANGVILPTTAGEAYAVKSGDTLSKIATTHGTTVKAIRSANNLTTDKIKVGQKLKIPAPSAAAPVTAPGQPVPAPANTPPAN